jgi:tRNA threonylcarbamoyl adenosine modification protein YeaZ
LTTYLALQSTYTNLELGIYRNDACLACVHIDKTKASKECVPTIAALLQQNKLTISNISFVGVNQGPGPFTTLRTAVATVNGLAFARTLPLVGVNGIETFLQEYAHQSTNVVALLNAFGSDLYFGIRTGSSYDEGCNSIDNVLLTVTQQIPAGPILFVGNGVALATEQIKNSFGDRAQTITPNPETVSLNAIASSALKQWNLKQNITYQLEPLYFKEAFYKL